MPIPAEIDNDRGQDERETHINFTTEDRHNGVAHIFTDDPVVYRQLLAKGHVPDQVTTGTALFEIEYRFITIRANKPKKKGNPNPFGHNDV